MKRVIPIILVLVLACSFAACGDKEVEQPTINITKPMATTNDVQDTSSDTTNPEALGYVLTTKPGETVPTVQTTQFVIGQTDQEPVPTGNFTVPSVQPPVVVTDFVPSTAPTVSTTIPTTPHGGTEPSTTKQVNEELWNDSSTTLVPGETERFNDETNQNKPLEVIGTANDEHGNVIIMFNYGDWDRIKSQKATAKVNCHGNSRSMKGTVNGVNDGGQFEYTVDISDLNPATGDFITMTFAQGAIESIGGGQKSAPCTVSLYFN